MRDFKSRRRLDIGESALVDFDTPFKIEPEDIKITDREDIRSECAVDELKAPIREIRENAADQFNAELTIEGLSNCDDTAENGDTNITISKAKLRDSALVLVSLTLGFMAGRCVFSGVSE